MFREFSKLILLLIAVLTFDGCIVKKTIEFEILKPAKQSIPSDVKKILLAVDKNEIKSAYFYSSEDTSYNVSLDYDQIFIDTIYKTFEKKFSEVGKYTGSGIIYYDGEMTIQACRSFCEANDVDGLIILDYLKFYLIQVPVDATGPGDTRSYFDNVGYSLNFRFYDNRRFKFDDTYNIEDSWEDTGKAATKANPAESLKVIANYVGGNSAEVYCNRISPHWEEVNRDFIVCPNTGFKIAYKQFLLGEMDSVVNLMRGYYNCNSDRIRHFALYNTALAYEFSDNPEEADKIIDIILLEKNRRFFKKYSYILFERILERKRLQNQVDW